MTHEQLKTYESQLKPCPFCGGKAEIRYDEIVDMYVVNCDGKTCEVVPLTAYFGDPEEAVEVWNTRSAESKVLEDIKTEIGYAFDNIEGFERVPIVIDNVLSIIDKLIEGNKK